jgi:signal transduction histidine kinase
VSTETIRSFLAEPRAPDPPGPARRDWMLVSACVAAAAVEATLRTDLDWRPFSFALVAGLAFVLPWRRTHPLVVMALAFGIVSAVDLAALLVDSEWESLGSAVFLLLIPYSLARWGSGREILAGVGVLVVPLVIVALRGEAIADLIGGVVVLALAVAIGAGVRFREVARHQERARIRSRERELLARELHDTVAHHVSAIAVQAQAGRAVAATRPDGALDALAVIEEEASRTLEEMRSMVGALRDGDRADLAPQHGVADIARLARSLDGGTPIDVELTGDLHGLRPSIDAAIYRLAQEAITNAVRHARAATLIRVRVCAEPTTVRLVVSDDGQGPSPKPAAPGFGLIGMEERVRLLGGSFEAGPAADLGWTVTASLPRNGVAT